MKDAAKKAIQVSGIAVTAAAAASLTAYTATEYLVNVALDRELPKTPKGAERLISGARPSEEFLRALREAGEKLAAKDNETVEITAHDGTLLVGHWIPNSDAKRVIIAMHGWRSAWYKDFGMISDFLEANGCSVLYAEQRGQNNSGGEYMGFGLIERHDCLDWINWVIGRCGSQIPIYLAGVSMGATTVLMAAGLDLPSNVRGIAGDCGFTSPRAIWKHVASSNLHLPYVLYGGIADSLCKKKIQCGSEDYSTLDALRATSVPVLLIHGEQDHFVPVEMTYENYDACASPKKLLIVPGADHGMSYFVDKEGYEAVVKDFWQECD